MITRNRLIPEIITVKGFPLIKPMYWHCHKKVGNAAVLQSLKECARTKDFAMWAAIDNFYYVATGYNGYEAGFLACDLLVEWAEWAKMNADPEGDEGDWDEPISQIHELAIRLEEFRTNGTSEETLRKMALEHLEPPQLQPTFWQKVAAWFLN